MKKEELTPPVEKEMLEKPQPVLKAECQHCAKVFDSKEQLDTHLSRLKEVKSNQAVVTLEYQPLIDVPDVYRHQARHQAASADGLTSDSWDKQWKEQSIENVKNFDPWKHSIGEVFGKSAYKPCIIAGSGPSLKKNAHLLKKEERGGIQMVSCLHNFAFFEDLGVKPEYYLTLDAGDIILKDLVEGGKEDPEFYWERTKKHTLVAAMVTHPDLLKKWQGKVLFFATGAPDMHASDFNIVFQTGGNALGACFYMAKAMLGANPLAFVGADFAFDYEKNFYSWKGPNQEFAGVVPARDVFGQPVYTWQSYKNFADWFIYVALGASGGHLPGTYVNCTEGGILGASINGNMRCLPPTNLSKFLEDYNCFKKMAPVIKDKTDKRVLF